MKSIYIETYGCSLNQSDSEAMAGLLKKAKFKIVNNEKKADVIIINTCTVKGPTENNFFRRLRKLKPLNKPIIIAGCIPQTDPEKVEEFSIIGPHELNNVVEVVQETLAGNVVKLLGTEKNPRLNLPKIRRNKIIEIIPICAGCLGSCTYCKVKAARGDLYSYKAEAIIKQAEQAIKDNCKEIWLTAQDTGCYGKDISNTLPNLVKQITELKGNFKIRIGMMNPNHVNEYLNELIEVYNHEKVFKFIHLPLQSGNNKILKAMNRFYTVGQFIKITNKLRKNIKHLTFSTDVICGFPGETKKQFQDTINAIKKIKPEVINISRYWPRPKTPAAEMKQLKGEETKNRSREMNIVFNKIAEKENQKWINWQGTIIIDEKGKNNTMIGRNFAYKPVIVKGKYPLGGEIQVKVKEATKHDLRAF